MMEFTGTETMVSNLIFTIFGIVGGIFALVVLVLSIAFAILMKNNIYGYGIKKFVDDKGNKQWQFYVTAVAQVVHIFMMVVLNTLATILLGTALVVLLQ